MFSCLFSSVYLFVALYLSFCFVFPVTDAKIYPFVQIESEANLLRWLASFGAYLGIRVYHSCMLTPLIFPSLSLHNPSPRQQCESVLTTGFVFMIWCILYNFLLTLSACSCVYVSDNAFVCRTFAFPVLYNSRYFF